MDDIKAVRDKLRMFSIMQGLKGVDVTEINEIIEDLDAIIGDM